MSNAPFEPTKEQLDEIKHFDKKQLRYELIWWKEVSKNQWKKLLEIKKITDNL